MRSLVFFLVLHVALGAWLSLPERAAAWAARCPTGLPESGSDADARLIACDDVPVAGTRDWLGQLPAGAAVPQPICPAPSGATPAPNPELTPNLLDCVSNGLYVGGTPLSCPAPGGARVRDLTLWSPALASHVMARVILPPTDDAPSGGFPVVFLLPGAGSTFQGWSCATNIVEYVRNANVIVIMPEGNLNSSAGTYYPDAITSSAVPGWYSDWDEPSFPLAGGATLNMNVQTHHLIELPQILARRFKANTGKMAVAGASMGGFGALYYAAQTTVRWKAAAALSAVADTEFCLTADDRFLCAPTLVHLSVNAAQLAHGQDPIGEKLWGESFGPLWQSKNPRRLAAQPTNPLRTLPLYVSAGQGSSRSTYVEDKKTLNFAELGAWYTTRDFLAALQRSDPNLKTQFFPKGQHDQVLADVSVCNALKSTLLPALGVPTSGISCPATLEASHTP
jgi:S-formylglutathione hydrolase FrmB